MKNVSGRVVRAALGFLPLAAAGIAAAAPPTAPDGLRQRIYSGRSAEVFWERSTDDVLVVGYDIVLDGRSLGVQDRLSYQFDALTRGRRYEVAVTAVDTDGLRSATSTVSFVAGERSVTVLPSAAPATPPGADGPPAPNGLRGEVYSRRSLEVFWDRVPGEAYDYEVSVDGEPREIVGGTSGYLSGLTPADRYRIDVVAIDRAGTRSAAAGLILSRDGSATPVAPTGPATPTAPTDAPVAGFDDARIDVYSGTAAELFWARVPGATRVDVLRDREPIGSSPGTSFYDDGRERGRTHRYDLVARDASGATLAEATVGGTGLPPTPARPPATSPAGFTDLRLARYSSTAAELFWTRPANAVRTEVVRSDGVAGDTPGTSFYDDARARDVDYGYALTAFDAAGALVATAALGEAEPDGPAAPAEPATPTGPTEPSAPAPASPFDRELFAPLADDIEPDRSIHRADGYAATDAVRVDLRTVPGDGPCTADDESGCTLDDVLADIDKTDGFTVDIPVHFSGDDFADDGQVANAELRLRGGGSRFAPQKSFRIKLDSKKDLWRNERFLQLNKHPFESSRQRNKLAMDLMSGVPHLPSFRTAFVNLWIDDGDGPRDYGLFTHVERPNDDYLRRHGLDDDGNLYKAEDFRFAPSDLADVAVDDEGEPLDEDRFESSLEIEEGEDHRPLVAMLRAVNDPAIPFETVLERHFNANNVLAWTATNFLLRQNDATRHNYLLYNPSGTETFYFLPWDYDAALGSWSLPSGDDTSNDALRRRLEYGYGLAGDNAFLDRYFRLPGVHERLVEATAFVRRNHLDGARAARLAEANAEVVAPFMARDPDREHNPDHRRDSWRQTVPTIAGNADAVRESFGLPVPPRLLAPRRVEGGVELGWSAAHDPTGGDVTYDLEIAPSPDFASGAVVDEDGIAGTGIVRFVVDDAALPSGTLYARLIARPADEPGRLWVPAANRKVVDGTQYHGIVELVVP